MSSASPSRSPAIEAKVEKEEVGAGVVVASPARSLRSATKVGVDSCARKRDLPSESPSKMNNLMMGAVGSPEDDGKEVCSAVKDDQPSSSPPAASATAAKKTAPDTKITDLGELLVLFQFVHGYPGGSLASIVKAYVDEWKPRLDSVSPTTDATSAPPPTHEGKVSVGQMRASLPLRLFWNEP